MSYIPIKNTLAAAMFQARQVIWLDSVGNHEEAGRAHERLTNTLETAAYPNITLMALARKLGRERARLIEIEPAVIEMAIKSPPCFVA